MTEETKKTKKTKTPARKKTVAKKPKKAEKIEKEIVETVKVEKPEIQKVEERYYEADGRRKTAVAQVRLWTKGEKEFLINQKPLEKYFSTFELQKTALASLDKMKCLDKFRVSVVVKGGGLSSQAEAVRHGIARALILFNADFRKRLKKAGFLTRDPRMRERKKFGLKRARRAPQWRKR